MGPSTEEYSRMSKVTVNLKGLERQILNLVRINMLKIGQKAYELNEDQIAKRKNKDGTRFHPYTTAYAKKKGVGKSNVNLVSNASALTDSQKKKPYGTMLKNFNVLRVKRYSVIIGFSSVWDRQKASWVVGGGKAKNRARPFVGLNKTNRRKLTRFAYKLIIQGTY